MILLEPMVLPTFEETLLNIIYTWKYFFERFLGVSLNKDRRNCQMKKHYEILGVSSDEQPVQKTILSLS